MSDYNTGDAVRVVMPRGVNKRGIPGISVLYTTWPEARFDGAVGADRGHRSAEQIWYSTLPGRFFRPTDSSRNTLAAAMVRQEWIVPTEERNAPREGSAEAVKATATAAELRPREST